ncbi:copper chaperone PCu(A)C [Natronohydrobacter thiooxidans]|uniref:copper chaperone PCu(A)C n=1 Tax=Natronohydrobacter thiooxidans TaxID=87172 RepID=UPI0008FF68A1|nr:copper chaperone PCu(A)C [Natronohydrobacter thiooxidans]
MKRLTLAAAFAAFTALPAFACEGIHIHDAYARASTAMSQSGAAFMQIINHGAMDRRLIGARSDVAERVEIHTHIEDDAGVMRMIEIEAGIVIPADGAHLLERGGDHLMFLGLTRPLEQGDEITVTLIFEEGEDMEVVIPVDLERMPEHGGSHSHDHSHDHSHGHSRD